ncbi:MAG: sigma-54-dependent Fis family transcriptional regulator [Deltaproteobacteria bacterium]|nr:sigma-54-dependent Fis family transcriptional regulator [Deltaproteobacteria bacterium]
MASILVIDDDREHLSAVADILTKTGYEVKATDDGETGLKEIEENDYDLILTDLMMPKVDGLDILRQAIAVSPKSKCIILTGYGTIRGSVEAMKKGAFDYITKPMTSNELLPTVEKALQFKHLEEENLRLKRELRKRYRESYIIGTSEGMKRLYHFIEKVADTDCTVLITGGSGTGKELIARAIHYDSHRRDKPMVTINCGAIPTELLESELFGHEKGAFTGAHKRRIGRFEMADGGTIFLDEVGEMSPALQVKLLRVLQEQTFERVGGTHTIHVDVRIIAATNKNLSQAINNEKFREDLYYRLNVIPIKVPSLKQRKEDIPLLITFFLNKFQRGKEKRDLGFSPQALEALLEYDWPGNVRELENFIKRMIILCDNDVIELSDLPEHLQYRSSTIREPDVETPEQGRTLNDAVRDYEKRLILEALEKSRGVKAKAAKLLNIKRTTLIEKMKKQNLTGNVSG